MIGYVEDTPNNQRLLARMLSKRNLQTHIWDNPYDGFDGVLDEQPEMLFVDVHLKTRDTGLDLVRWLRKAGYDKPIVVVTCFNMLADRNRALEAGCDDYLSKPYNLNELYTIIDRWLPSMAPAS